MHLHESICHTLNTNADGAIAHVRVFSFFNGVIVLVNYLFRNNSKLEKENQNVV